MLDTDTFCTKCGTPVEPKVQQAAPQAPPMQQAYQAPPQAPPMQQAAQAPPVQQAYQTPPAPGAYAAPSPVKDGVFGKAGGLFIYGALIILMIIIGAVSSGYFTDSRNLGNIGSSLLMMLPMAFAIGITMKHKGLDMSFPAMTAITSVIICTTPSLAAGIAISLVVCLIFGAVNALLIHFLKLPGMLVTITTLFITNVILSFMRVNVLQNPLRNEPGLMYVVVFIAAIVAVAIALLSSIGKDHRNKLFPTLLVYAGSGILAVLYYLALAFRVQVAIFYGSSQMLTALLFVAVFIGITRFFKSKGLGMTFAIIPSILFVIVRNVMVLTGADSFIQSLILYVFILIMLFLQFYGGRAQLIGQNRDKMYNAKSWIGLIPLFLLILVEIVFVVILISTQNSVSFGFSPALAFMSGPVIDVILLLVGVGACIVHAAAKPKGAGLV